MREALSVVGKHCRQKVEQGYSREEIWLLDAGLQALHRLEELRWSCRGDKAASTTTDFVAELVRAANEVEKLGAHEKVRLLDRAITTIRVLREQVRIPSSVTAADAVVGLQSTRVAMARGKGTSEHLKAALLDAADMIRSLHIAVVSNTATDTGEGTEH